MNTIMSATAMTRRMNKMSTVIFIIISFLCLVCVCQGVCLLSLISDKLSKVITLLEEIRNTPSIFATKIEKGYSPMDNNVYYIHYNKDELVRPRK